MATPPPLGLCMTPGPDHVYLSSLSSSSTRKPSSCAAVGIFCSLSAASILSSCIYVVIGHLCPPSFYCTCWWWGTLHDTDGRTCNHKPPQIRSHPLPPFTVPSMARRVRGGGDFQIHLHCDFILWHYYPPNDICKARQTPLYHTYMPSPPVNPTPRVPRTRSRLNHRI